MMSFIGWQRAATGYCARKQSDGDGDGRSRESGLIRISRAVIGRIDNEVVVSNGKLIAESGQGIAVGIEQGQVNIGGPGIVDAVLLMQPEFDLHQHTGLLLHGVVTQERNLQPLAFDVADRRFPHKLNRHADPPFPSCFINRTTSALIISKAVCPRAWAVRAFSRMTLPEAIRACATNRPHRETVQSVDSPAVLRASASS